MKKLTTILTFLLVITSLYSCKSIRNDLSQVPPPSPFNNWINVTCDVYCEIKYDPRSQENTKITDYIACVGTKEACINYTTDSSHGLQVNESAKTLSKDNNGFYVGKIYKPDTAATCIYLVGVRGNSSDYVIKGYDMPGKKCLNP